MQELTVKQVFPSDSNYQQVLLLRDKVLRKPLGLSLFEEDLSADADDITLAGYSAEGDLIACLMLHPVEENTLKLRQMAVADEWQKKGIGRLLVRNAEELARQKGYKEMVLHARITARDFYKGLGYEASGEVFTEVTIPHILMKKAL